MSESMERRIPFELDDANAWERLDERALSSARTAMQSLRVSNRVRAIGQQAIDGEQPSAADIDWLTERLSRMSESRWRDRVIAIWTLGVVEMNPERRLKANELVARITSDTFLKPVVRVGERFYRYALRSLLIVAAGVLAYRAVDGDAIVSGDPVGLDPVTMIAMFTFMALVMAPLFSPALDAKRNDRAREMGAWYLGRNGTVGAAHALCAVANRKFESEPAIRNLVRLIRRNELTADRLDPKSRADVTQALCRSLKRDGTSIALELVAAIRDVGDQSALRQLAKLKKTIFRYQSVIDLVDEAIAAIEERSLREASENELLRASDQIDLPDTLLRPAACNVDTAPEQLLRPGMIDES